MTSWRPVAPYRGNSRNGSPAKSAAETAAAFVRRCPLGTARNQPERAKVIDTQAFRFYRASGEGNVHGADAQSVRVMRDQKMCELDAEGRVPHAKRPDRFGDQVEARRPKREAEADVASGSVEPIANDLLRQLGLSQHDAGLSNEGEAGLGELTLARAADEELRPGAAPPGRQCAGSAVAVTCGAPPRRA